MVLPVLRRFFHHGVYPAYPVAEALFRNPLQPVSGPDLLFALSGSWTDPVDAG
jgi:hypothetical protein